jgi:hypothetical protein
VNARAKIVEGKPLGFEIEPLLEAAKKRPVSGAAPDSGR